MSMPWMFTVEQSASNLNDLETRRDLELGYPVHEAVRDSVVRRDVNVAKSSSLQELVGQPSALSQDALSALIVRQRSVTD